MMGVNDDKYDPDAHTIISNASCTTNCVAPMAKVLLDSFGIVKGLMTTVHAYTKDQILQDGPHKDLRRARAAAQNIVPDLHRRRQGHQPGDPRAQGQARRLLAARPGAGRLDHRPGRRAGPGRHQGRGQRRVQGRRRGRRSRASSYYTEDPIVSSDIVGSPASCTFDASITMAYGNQVKVFGWYDNEWGYSSRLVDLTALVASRLR